MRTASMVLGIIGGCLAILLAALILIGSSYAVNGYWTWNGAGIPLVMGIVSGIAGILGLVGGIIVRNRNVASGVMMIIAAVASICTLINFVSGILFILAAVFALVKESPRQAAYSPVPPGYGPVPPYGQPPRPYGAVPPGYPVPPYGQPPRPYGAVPPGYGPVPPAYNQNPVNPQTPPSGGMNGGELR